MKLSAACTAPTQPLMNTYTPGPWASRAIDADETIIEAVSPSAAFGAVARGVVAHCTYVERVNDAGEANHRANARLIAAAPDLLEALESLEKFLRAEDIPLPIDMLEQCNAALTKAIQS